MNSKEARMPIIYGTGFVGLDVVVDRITGVESMFAGGTCGNVLTILAFLGWQSIPIARLAEDAAGDLVREDLARWGVKLDQIGLEPKSATPIVIEEIYKNRVGLPKHRYVWTCPDCGGYLPQYRPVLSRTVSSLSVKHASQAFFFDRVSRGAVDLAKKFADEGAVIVFEPSGSSDPRLFREASRICHILKYSSQRVRAFADLLKSSKALIEIETLGDDGLRYRTRLPFADGYSWKNLPPFQVEHVKDAAGSGDWCSAGLLFKIAGQGQEQLSKTTPELLEQALQFGQALAAWNCAFPSARGGMHAMSRSAILKAVERIIAGSAGRPRLMVARPHRTQAALFCPSCGIPGSRQHAPTRPKLHRAV